MERFLKDEPVEARPPSAWYRLRKLFRRNKAAVVTTAVIAAVLVLVSLVSTWQAIRATRAEAEPLLVEAYELLKKLSERPRFAPTPLQRVLQVETLGWLVQLYTEWGKPNEAAERRKGLEAAKEAAKKPKASVEPSGRRGLASSHMTPHRAPSRKGSSRHRGELGPNPFQKPPPN